VCRAAPSPAGNAAAKAIASHVPSAKRDNQAQLENLQRRAIEAGRSRGFQHGVRRPGRRSGTHRRIEKSPKLADCGHTEDLELRLMSRFADGTWLAIAFGGGDFRLATEQRGTPRVLVVGTDLGFGHGSVRASYR